METPDPSEHLFREALFLACFVSGAGLLVAFGHLIIADFLTEFGVVFIFLYLGIPYAIGFAVSSFFSLYALVKLIRSKGPVAAAPLACNAGSLAAVAVLPFDRIAIELHRWYHALGGPSVGHLGV